MSATAPSRRMRLLFIGGHGFIGARTVAQALTQGHQVSCMLRPGSDARRLAALPWRRLEGDVRDPAALEAAIDGCDAVVHLASPSSWNDIDSPALRDIVVTGTARVIEALRRRPHTRLVYVSSAAAVNGAEEPTVFDENAVFSLPAGGFAYAFAKREAEALCRAAAAEGLQVTIVNPTETYGPQDIGLITAGTLVDLGKPGPAFVCRGGTSVVHVDDVAAGILAALERGRAGERYILGGDNLTIEELVAQALGLIGRPARIVRVPNRLLRGAARLSLACGLPFPMNPQVVPYATQFWFMDNAKARRELGVNFRSAREVLAPTITWLRESGHLPPAAA